MWRVYVACFAPSCLDCPLRVCLSPVSWRHLKAFKLEQSFSARFDECPNREGVLGGPNGLRAPGGFHGVRALEGPNWILGALEGPKGVKIRVAPHRLKAL